MQLKKGNEKIIKRERDMKRRYIIKTIKILLLIIILLAGVKGILVYCDYKAEEERMAQKPYFTKYKLTATEMGVLDAEYHVKVTPTIENMDKEDWPDYSYVTIEATEDTKIVVTVMNYWLFDDLSEVDKDAWEKATEYGFTTSNRITVDWVMEHPREAVEIMDSMASYGEIFQELREWIYPIYERITGEKIET